MDDKKLTDEQRKRLAETEPTEEGQERLLEDIERIETEDDHDADLKLEMESEE